MLQNAYFLAKVGFDTAGNEPAKNLQIFANLQNRRREQLLPDYDAASGRARSVYSTFHFPLEAGSAAEFSATFGRTLS